MSNVKEVRVTGRVPFDAHQRDKGWLGWIAEMNAPCFGLRISYVGKATEMVPNDHGGITAMYDFTITGEEAVSWGALKDLCDSVRRAGGRLHYAQARDMEDNGAWGGIE